MVREPLLHSLLNFRDLQALKISYQPTFYENQYLVIDLDESSPDGLELEQVGRWLADQAKVVVGLTALAGTTTETNGLHRFMDVIASSEAELTRIIGQIEANPICSIVLVQVLRVTSDMPVADALTVESLAFSTLQSGGEFREWLNNYRKTHLEQLPHKEASQSPAVLLSREGDELHIVLNRPNNQNAFTAEMRDALFEAVQLVALDNTIKCAHISAEGPCFSTGGDLKEFGQFNNAAEAHMIRTLRLPGRIIADIPDKFEFQLHRACIGSGIEIPAFANRVSATSKTYFQLPEISMGLIPGAGGCISIPRRIGRQRTAFLALSGKRINARTALDWGLIDSIID